MLFTVLATQHDDDISTGSENDLHDDVTLLSDAQFYVTDRGASVKLECAFRSELYNLFDYPVIWRKQQLTEWTQINVMWRYTADAAANCR